MHQLLLAPPLHFRFHFDTRRVITVANYSLTGINPKELPDIVNSFYASSRLNLGSAREDGSLFRSRVPVVDEPFLEQIWTWLTKHPDVYVGPNKEGNHLSYSEIQDRNLKAGTNPRTTQHDLLTNGSDSANAEQRDQSRVPADRPTSQPDGDVEQALRLYGSEERMWLAVCGHPRDDSRIFQTEFTLLSIIASRRNKGVLQGDLVRLSGQDKRSVPHRTDVLRDKGYLEKRPVLAKGSRTSLLVLKQFATAPKTAAGSKREGPVVGSDANHPLNIVDFTSLVKDVFEVIGRNGLITRVDLKQQLGLNKRIQWVRLSRLIRRFEAWGCLRRVRAASKHSAALKWRYPCVKLIRQPTEQEIENYAAIGGGVTSREDDVDIDAEGEDDDEPPEALNESGSPDLAALEESGRNQPVWNPDRPLANQLAHVIDNAGTEGITQTQLQQSILGPLAGRPLQFLLGRLVESWALAQPGHLRHFSVIQDTAVSKIAYFLHYTFRNFQKLVDQGTAFWEAVIVTGKPNAKSTERIKSLLSQPAVDDFGFPVTMRPAGQYKGGDATMREIIRSVNPGGWHLTNLDPVVVEVDGRDQIGYGSVNVKKNGKPSERRHTRGSSATLQMTPRENESRQSTPQATVLRKRSKQKEYRDGRKPTGRPRKYERGTEKFWRLLGIRQLRSRGLEVKGKAIMSHPLVTQMIENRPEGFDDVYLRAAQTGAPVPVYPTDLTETWVEKTRLFLDRSLSGVHVSPTMTMSPELTTSNRFKMIVVIKSGRLQECSFSELRTVSARKTAVVHFFTSSRAHTLLIPTRIPESKFGSPLNWLIPTLSGSIPKPPGASLPVPVQSPPSAVRYLPSVAAHTIPHLGSRRRTTRRAPTIRATNKSPGRYFPSIAAHTIPYLGSSGRTAKRGSTNRTTNKTPGKVLSEPSAKRRKIAEDKPLPTPGPKLGLFDMDTGLIPTSVDSSPLRLTSPVSQAAAQSVDNTSGTVQNQTGARQKDDFQVVSIDARLVRPETPDRRSLRSAITPSAKQRETLQQGRSLYRRTVGGEASPLARHSIFNRIEELAGDGGEMKYLNSPSHTSPRSVKEPPKKEKKSRRKQPSSLLARAVTTDISSAVSTSEKENGNDSNLQQCGRQSADDVVDAATLPSEPPKDIETSSIQLDASGNQPIRETPEKAADDDAMWEDSSPIQDPMDDAREHIEDGDDSDVTIDLGPDKFLLSPARPGKPQFAEIPAIQRSTNSALAKKTRGASAMAADQSQAASEDNGVIHAGETAISNAAENESQLPRQSDPTKEAGTENKTVQPNAQGKDDGTGQETSAEPEQNDLPKVQSEQRKTSTFQTRKKRKLDVWEGSIGYFRRKIVQDVVEKCNGIIPFAGPLFYVFATAWMKSGWKTKPDHRTLRAAVKSLIDSGQLKQLKFAFKDSRGLMTTQAMLARPNIKVSDPIVRRLQKDIIDTYPQPFVPEEFEIDPSLRFSDGNPSGVYKRPDAIANEMVQTEHRPAIIRKTEEKRKAAELRTRLRANQLIKPRAFQRALQPIRFDPEAVQTRPLEPTQALEPRQPRVKRLERIGGPHQLVKPKATNFKLPQTQRLLFGTVSKDAAPVLSPEAEAAAARERLNDRKRKTLPHSLADVPDRRYKKVDHAQADDPAYSKFIWDLEKVERWEAKKEGLFDSETPDEWQFINHQLLEPFEEASRQGPVAFKAWSWFNENGEEVSGENPPDINLLKQSTRATMIMETSTGRGHRKKRARNFFGDENSAAINEQVPGSTRAVDLPQPNRKRKFLGNLQNPRPAKDRRVEQLQAATFDPKVLFPDSVTKAVRKPQILRNMPEEMLYKLMVTFAVVRVLAGGVEKYIDWSIINQVFPDETEQFLKDRWRTLRVKYRHYMRRYHDNFQELFLEAYEHDELPQFDYDDVANNDWNSIIEWAMGMLEKPVKHDVEDLPASRTEFDVYQKIAVEPSNRPLRDLYAYNTNANLTQKENAAAATPFAIPVTTADRENKENIAVPSDQIAPSVTQPVQPPQSALQAVARSWTLATVLTPDDQYSGPEANAKISTLPGYNDLLEDAVKVLTNARIIVNANKTSSTSGVARLPGRAYDISSHLLNTLSKKRSINHEMLKRAMWYKLNVLDAAFSSIPAQKVRFDIDAAEDGDMVAVLNLAASGRIIIRPSSSKKPGERIPANRYGLIDNYQTRFMDKKLFRFTVELEVLPTHKWITGNPLLSERSQNTRQDKLVHQAMGRILPEVFPVPRGGMDMRLPDKRTSRLVTTSEALSSDDVTPARIPIYFSIHGQFLSWIWDMVIAAVVGVIASRPGLSTTEIFNMLHPAVEMEDLRMVLRWLQDVDAVKIRRGGSGGACWELGDWWWCICDSIATDGAGVQGFNEQDTQG